MPTWMWWALRLVAIGVILLCWEWLRESKYREEDDGWHGYF